MSIYAIGDIHGEKALLSDLLTLITEDAAAANQTRRRVVILGDMIDRGMDSCGVIDLLT